MRELSLPRSLVYRPLPLAWWRARYNRAYAEALIAYGEVFDATAAQMQLTLDPAKRLAFEFRWWPSDRFDAFTGRRRNSARLIVLSTHCWSQVQTLAIRYYSARDLAPEIGDAAAESQDLAACAHDPAWLEGAVDPRCPVRREASFITAEFAMMIIYLHEVAHSALGHLEGDAGRRLHERFQRRALSRPRRFSTTNDTEHSRLGEAHADAFALLTFTARARNHHGAFQGQLVPHVLRPHLYTLAYIAQTIVHMCFSGRSRPLADYAHAAHPHPFVRLLTCVGIAGATSDDGRANDPASWSSAADVFRLFQYARSEAVTTVSWDEMSPAIADEAKRMVARVGKELEQPARHFDHRDAVRGISMAEAPSSAEQEHEA